MTGAAETAILQLLDQAGDRSVTPEAVARALDSQDWRKRLPEVRRAAVALAREGSVVVLRHGRPVDAADFKGVYRLGRPRPLEP